MTPPDPDSAYAALERSLALLTQEVRAAGAAHTLALGEIRTAISDMRREVGRLDERVTALEIAREREKAREQARLEFEQRKEAHDRGLVWAELPTLVKALAFLAAAAAAFLGGTAVPHL